MDATRERKEKGDGATGPQASCLQRRVFQRRRTSQVSGRESLFVLRTMQDGCCGQSLRRLLSRLSLSPSLPPLR
jgi:hypothetical protein